MLKIKRAIIKDYIGMINLFFITFKTDKIRQIELVP
jgi:hypothetical protein